MNSENSTTIWKANSEGEYAFDSPRHSESHKYLIPSIRKLTDNAEPSCRAVDFGCGNGSLIAAFRDKNWNLHGIDISVSGIRQAQKAYPFVNFSIADIAAKEFTHPLMGTCDLVISTEVVEHLLLPRYFAKNCASLLKPEGKLIISTPYHGYLKNLTLALSGKLDRHFHALWDYGHVKFWSRRTLTALFEEAGLTVTNFSGSGRLPYLWKSMLLECRKPR